jgi:beta-lactamase regulating signal transducer with metallopeptidase domain
VFTWLCYNTLCAAPLAVVALLVRRSARVAPAVEHLLWLLVLVRLVLPPFPLQPAAPGSSGSASAVVSSAPPSLGDELVAATTRLLGPNWSHWVPQVLLALFAAALTFVVARELLRARAVERCVRRASAAEAPLADLVAALAEDLGVPAPRVRVSPEVSGPFLWSLRGPVLVLSAARTAPDPTVLAHLRRRDHWTAWFELLVQALHFWNPLFWLARRGLHRAAELACDGWVVRRFPGRRHAFASALVDVAEHASGARPAPRAAHAIGMDPRDFEERLVRILARETRPTSRGLIAAALVCAGLTLPGIAAPSLHGFRAALPELPQGDDLEHRQRSLANAEARVRAAADDGAAQAQLGLALLSLGDARASLTAFERQEALGHQPAKALYNQACALVRLGELDAALGRLLRAADLGLDVSGLAAVDPDLAELRAALGLEPGDTTSSE